jgi:hypothetical protein
MLDVETSPGAYALANRSYLMPRAEWLSSREAIESADFHRNSFSVFELSSFHILLQVNSCLTVGFKSVTANSAEQ